MTLLERFEGSTLAASLSHRATSDPSRPYLVFDDGVRTVGQVETESESLAAALANRGVEPGDRIALVLPPCPEFVVSMFAAAKLGAIVVPLNPKLSSSDLQYTLRHSAAACAVTIERSDGVDYLGLFDELMPQLPDLRFLVTAGEEDLWYGDRVFQFEDLLSSGSGRDYAAAAVHAKDECFALVYTSGTVGKPKGVELSHANLLSVAAGTADRIGLGEDDRVIGVSALFHVFGLGPGLLSSLLAGASMVLQRESGPAATLRGVVQHEATVHYGTPTLFVQELRQLEAERPDLSALRLAVISGAPVSDELVRRVATEMDVTVTSAYSLTETASTVAASSPDDTPEQRRFTVGRPLEGTKVRILEADGSELPVESVGQIAVRGPGVMLGYFRQPGETSAAFDDDGFFLTGDLGLMDEEGCLHLVGRLKDVIIRSGFNVYPREVAARIEAHPAVQEVAVVGVSDPLLGEAICACIVPVEGAVVTGREVVDWCRETLADDKVPDLVRFIDELPRTDTGQVRRADLSRLAQSEGQSV